MTSLLIFKLPTYIYPSSRNLEPVFSYQEELIQAALLITKVHAESYIHGTDTLMNPPNTMEQQHIDQLLERYLSLLDEYTQLRQRLSQIQSAVYQNIARANFSGERGMRHGQDHYDERMQATRLLSINQDESPSPDFSIYNFIDEDEERELEKDGSETREKKAKEEKRNKNKNPLHWFGLFAPMPLRTAQAQSVQAVEEIIPRLVSVNAEMLETEIEVRRARKRRARAEAAEKRLDRVSTDTQPQGTEIK